VRNVFHSSGPSVKGGSTSFGIGFADLQA